MAEYIEREALIERLELLARHEDGFRQSVILGVVHGIKHEPTADVVEVVRCKDCKHWECYGGEDKHKGDCLELVGLDSCMYENDFCSYGERKDDGNVG